MSAWQRNSAQQGVGYKRAREEDLLALQVQPSADDVARLVRRPVLVALVVVPLLAVLAQVPVAVGLPPGSGSGIGSRRCQGQLREDVQGPEIAHGVFAGRVETLLM